MPVTNFSTSEGFATRFQYGVVGGARNLTGTTDAISSSPGIPNFLVAGNWYINTAAVDAITLVAPIAGGGFAGGVGGVYPNLLGNDDFELYFISTTAFAHTVTTPAGKINGTLHIATFAAAIGNYIHFVAKGGIWYALDSKGITLT